MHAQSGAGALVFVGCSNHLSKPNRTDVRTQAPVVRQKLVPLQNLPSARGCKFPFVICNEEKEGRREEREWHHRGEGRVHDPLPHLRLIALDAGRYRSPVARFLSISQ